MRPLGATERVAVDAVAKRFSAGWNASDACLTIDGRRVAVVALAMDAGPGAAPRLRFDKVALRLVRQLQSALSPAIPDGEAVILTVTAPIRLAGQTVAALTALVQGGLAGKAALDLSETIHGNQVRARRVSGVARRAAKVVGFVHNPGPGQAEALLAASECLLRGLGAVEDSAADDGAELWLVIADPDGAAPLKTWGQVLDQLGVQGGPAKILLAGPDGRIDELVA